MVRPTRSQGQCMGIKVLGRVVVLRGFMVEGKRYWWRSMISIRRVELRRKKKKAPWSKHVHYHDGSHGLNLKISLSTLLFSTTVRIQLLPLLSLYHELDFESLKFWTRLRVVHGQGFDLASTSSSTSTSIIDISDIISTNVHIQVDYMD